MDVIIDLFNPSTTIGSLLIGIISALISGLILGFLQEKSMKLINSQLREIKVQ